MSSFDPAKLKELPFDPSKLQVVESGAPETFEFDPERLQATDPVDPDTRNAWTKFSDAVVKMAGFYEVPAADGVPKTTWVGPWPEGTSFRLDDTDKVQVELADGRSFPLPPHTMAPPSPQDYKALGIPEDIHQWKMKQYEESVGVSIAGGGTMQLLNAPKSKIAGWFGGITTKALEKLRALKKAGKDPVLALPGPEDVKLLPPPIPKPAIPMGGKVGSGPTIHLGDGLPKGKPLPKPGAMTSAKPVHQPKTIQELAKETLRPTPKFLRTAEDQLLITNEAAFLHKAKELGFTVKKFNGGRLKLVNQKTGAPHSFKSRSGAVEFFAKQTPVFERLEKEVVEEVANAAQKNVLQGKAYHEAARKAGVINTTEMNALNKATQVINQVEDPAVTAARAASRDAVLKTGAKQSGKSANVQGKAAKETDEILPSDTLEESFKNGKWRAMDFYKYFVSLTGGVKAFGKGGQEIARRMQKVVNEPDLRTAAMLLSSKAHGLTAKSTFKAQYEALKQAEKDQLTEYLHRAYYDPKVKAPSAKVKKAADEFFRVTKEVGDEAKALGVKVEKIDPVTNKKILVDPGDARMFFPQQILHGKKIKSNKFYQYLVKSGQAKSLAEAEDMVLQKLARQSTFGRKYPGLEHAREFHVQGLKELKEFGYVTDPYMALNNYVSGVYNRIAEIKYYGKNDEVIKGLLKSIEAEGMDARLAARFFRHAVSGPVDAQPLAQMIYGKVMSFNAATMLGWAQMLQVGQGLTNPVLKFGLTNGIKGVIKSFGKHGREYAEATGAISEAMLREVRANLGAGNISEKALKWYGFTSTDMWARRVGAIAGEQYAKHALKKLSKNTASKLYRSRLKEVGINADEALKRGHLSQNEIRMAGKMGSDTTQFRARRENLPWFFTASPFFKALNQFKSFQFFQSKFLKDEFKLAVKEAKMGKPTRMVKYLGTLSIWYPAIGEIVADARAGGQNAVFWALGSDVRRVRPEAFMDRYIDNIAHVGGLGIFMDIASAIGRGRYGLGAYLQGPTIGQAGQIMDAAGTAVTQGDPNKLVKFILSKLGPLGTPLAQAMYPPATNRSTYYRTPKKLPD